MKRAYHASDSATSATSSVTSHSSAPAPKRKRGRPPKHKAVASVPPPFRSFASLFRDGLVPVSALNACLEHDSLAGARAFAGREAMAALQQAQESLRAKGFVVLYVDAPPR